MTQGLRADPFNNRKNEDQGFTLIELLVVIAIIGLLTSMALVALNNARLKARDAKRLADMRQIQTALDMYYDQYGQYPDPDSEAGCFGWDTSSVGNFISALVNPAIASKVPLDPVNSGNCYTGYAYRYYRYTAGYGGCDQTRGAFYVLSINKMDSVSGVYPQSPGWACTGSANGGPIDWQAATAAQWVTGKYEK